MTVLKWILVLVVSYLLGCIQTGVIISGAQHVDIRAHGSKSTGTTNVFRVLGAKASLVTFVGDVLKGVLALPAGALAAWQHGRVPGGHRGGAGTYVPRLL